MSWVGIIQLSVLVYCSLFGLALLWALNQRDLREHEALLDRVCGPKLNTVEVLPYPEPKTLQLQELPPAVICWYDVVKDDKGLKSEDKLLLAIGLAGAEYFIRRM